MLADEDVAAVPFLEAVIATDSGPVRTPVLIAELEDGLVFPVEEME